MPRRKQLLLLLFIVMSVAIGYGVYRLFFAGPSVPEVPVTPGQTTTPGGGLQPAPIGSGQVETGTGTTLPSGGTSPVAQGGVTAVTPVATVPTIGATLASTGAVSFYNKLDGKFYRRNTDGTVSSLSNKEFRNVQAATFDPKGEKAIIEFPDGANVVFDFNRQVQSTLPKHWESFAWNADGGTIAAKSIGIDDANRFLVVAKADGSGARAVQELGANANKVTVSFSPDNQVVGFAATGRSFGVDRKEIYLLGQNQENFKSLVVEGLNFIPKWAPSGRSLLYSVAGSGADYKPQLWLVDAQGDTIGANRRSLPVNTWADKCAFGATDSELYCAVPQELQRGAGLQPSVADGTPDSIVKINVTTGLMTTIAIPEGRHTVGSLMLTPDGKTLVFTDKGSGILNTIRLSE
jgi:hypothetical protein